MATTLQQPVLGLGRVGLPTRMKIKVRMNTKSPRLPSKPRHGKTSVLRATARRLQTQKLSSLPSRSRIVRSPQCISQTQGPSQAQTLWKPTLPILRPKRLLNAASEKLSAFSEEWKTFLPMGLLFFMMAFVNTVVNNLSISLVVTAPGGGPGVIPFLTAYAAFPLTLGATVLYAYASHYVSSRKLFTITVGIFAAFNLVFALCLFPNHEVLHLPGVADALSKVLPSGLNGAVGMVRNWTFSIFFCLSEMWGDMGITLLFWGFANEITTSKQAPIMYPLMGIGANVAQTLGGIVLTLFSAGSAAAVSSRYQTLLFQMVGCMIAVMGIHHYVAHRAEKRQQKESLPSSGVDRRYKIQENKLVLDVGKEEKTNQENRQKTTKQKMSYGCVSRFKAIRKTDASGIFNVSKHHSSMMASFRKQSPVHSLATLPLISVSSEPTSTKRTESEPRKRPLKSIPQRKNAVTPSSSKKEEKKSEPTFWESIKTMTGSPVVKGLAVMTIAQALSVTCIEYVWRSHLNLAYPTAAAFTAFMGNVSTLIGLATGAMMILSPVLFNRVGWKGVASITPVLMTMGGMGFFVLCTAYHVLNQCGMTQLTSQILPITVSAGAFLWVLSRSTKFSLFKPSEEMVYIQMDKSQRTKSKAAVDVVGANLGKSGGSLLQQALLVISGGHLLAITPVMFGLYMAMMHGWNKAVGTLANFQENKTKESEPLESHPVSQEDDEDILEEFDESTGSSVVEFNIHSDRNESVTV